MRPRVTSVCSLCRQIIGEDHRPTGRYPINPNAPGLSHGLCLACAPGYCASMGLSESETARIINTFLQGGASATKKPQTASAVSPVNYVTSC